MPSHSDPSSADPTSPSRQGMLGSASRQPSRLQHEGLRSPVTPYITGRLNTTSANNSTINETDNIKVAVRVRPLLPDKMDKDKGAVSVLQVADDHTTLKVVVPGPAGNKMQRDFQFHACLGPSVSQAEVLHLCGIPQLLDAALAGYNVTIFAYGQTGSGKTYTMSGREEVIGQDSYHGDTNDGIISRSVSYLYQQLRERTDAKFKLSASYLEIYNEAVHDLLTRNLPHTSNNLSSGASTVNLSATSAGGSHSSIPQTAGGRPVGLARDLAIKWDPLQGFFVPGLKQVACTTLEQMMEVIRTGMQHRHMGSHELNMESSRSHSLMTIHCAAVSTDAAAWDYGTPRYGKICFVDLAGSERLKDSKSEGTMLKETTNINKSLFVLGKVISALAERDSAGVTTSHIPYRDSKLTKLLMDSLGGSALALMIACCSPSPSHVEETLSTLSYATRAKNIQNRPIVQYDPKEAQITALRREIELLRQENHYLRDQLSMVGAITASGTPITPGLSVGSNLQPSYQPAPVEDGVNRTITTRVDWPAFRQDAGASSGHSNAQQVQGASLESASSHAARYELHSSGSSLGSEPASAFSPVPLAARTGTGAASTAGARPRMHAAAQNDSDNTLESGQMVLSAVRPSSGSTWKHGGPHGSALGGHGADDLTLRLKETQVLLAKFSEENNRLAKENDRLRTGRVIMNTEHASVLEEIEALRSQLSGLETAVLAGNAAPGAVKALLSGLKTQPYDSQRSTPQLTPAGQNINQLRIGSTGMPVPTHSNSGSPLTPNKTPSLKVTPMEDASHRQHVQVVADDSSVSVSESFDGGFGSNKQLGAQNAGGLVAPTASMTWSPSTSRPGSRVSVVGAQPWQGQAGTMMHGTGMVGRDPCSPLLASPPSSSAQPQAQSPGQQHTHAKGAADVLAVGTGGAAALRARSQTSDPSNAGDAASPAISVLSGKPAGGIIVADPSKLALLLGGEGAGRGGAGGMAGGSGAGSLSATPVRHASPAVTSPGNTQNLMQHPQPQQGAMTGLYGGTAAQRQWQLSSVQPQGVGSPQSWHPHAAATSPHQTAAGSGLNMARYPPTQLASPATSGALQHGGQYMVPTPPIGYVGHSGVPQGWEGAVPAAQQPGPGGGAAAFRSMPHYNNRSGKGL